MHLEGCEGLDEPQSALPFFESFYPLPKVGLLSPDLSLIGLITECRCIFLMYNNNPSSKSP